MGANTTYTPFNGICLTDTFQLEEEFSDDNLYSEEFPTNSRRVMEQKKKPITVTSAIRRIPSDRNRPTIMHKTRTIRGLKNRSQIPMSPNLCCAQ